MEVIESSECVTDLPELESDTCHLGRYPEESHECYTDSTDSPRRKTPEICRKYSDTEDDKNFEFFRHIMLE
jgi:hypothetical protein